MNISRLAGRALFQCSPSASACTAYREAIELGLSRGRNAMAIWQGLVDEYSFASSYCTAAMQLVPRKERPLRLVGGG